MAIEDEHYRKLERMYAAAPVNEFFEPKLTVGEARAEVHIQIGQKFFHSAGAMHGVVYFKALDDSTFFAAQSVVAEYFVLTAHFELDLLKPVSGGSVVAKAIVTKRSGRRVYAEAELCDEAGHCVAKGEGVFVISEQKLGPEIHYC